MKKITQKTIEEENPHIILSIIAESVAEQSVVRNLKTQFDDWGILDQSQKEELEAKYQAEVNRLTQYLCERANTCYQYNTDFNKKVKGRGNKGRDALYTFMYHWADGNYKTSIANWKRERDQFNKVLN